MFYRTAPVFIAVAKFLGDFDLQIKGQHIHGAPGCQM
jgi:hypothetical protein